MGVAVRRISLREAITIDWLNGGFPPLSRGQQEPRACWRFYPVGFLYKMRSLSFLKLVAMGDFRQFLAWPDSCLPRCGQIAISTTTRKRGSAAAPATEGVKDA